MSGRPLRGALLCGIALILGLAAQCPLIAHAQAGSEELAIDFAGQKRTFTVHLPAKFDTRVGVPLVVMLHGGGGTARAAMWETGWAAKADREGFIVAFPEALARDPARPASLAANPRLWNDGSERFYPAQSPVDDVGFIAAMLDDLGRRHAIDARRVYVSGFSNGASMAFRVGAALPDRIAAIAPVAGALWTDPVKLARPVSMLYITGSADPLNPIEGGVPRLPGGPSDLVRAKIKPPVRESIRQWAGALGCPATPPAAGEVDGMRTETRSRCAGGAEVVYIEIEGQGHTWAGGSGLLPARLVGASSNRIVATDVIWDFFRRHVRSP